MLDTSVEQVLVALGEAEEEGVVVAEGAGTNSRWVAAAAVLLLALSCSHSDCKASCIHHIYVQVRQQHCGV